MIPFHDTKKTTGSAWFAVCYFDVLEKMRGYFRLLIEKEEWNRTN